jgi:hypothetical protein
MSERQCHHPDVRKFDGVRCCLACGEAVFETVNLKIFDAEPSTPMLYEYAHLNYQLGQEVRLLVLRPGEYSDQLRCDIIHVNLEDEPEYDAVSYTWSSNNEETTLPRSINCGISKYISITANCDTALRQLRRRGLKQRLWIDAVCINQTNNDERNHQVRFMDRIYSQAQSVRICISQQSTLADFFTYGKLFRWLQDERETEAWVRPALQELLSHRYFKRAWVMQEVILARTAYLLVNDDELLLSYEVMDRLILIAKPLGKDDYQLPAVLNLRNNADRTPITSIVTCLHAGITSQCTDARDKVFAVLSLMDSQSRSLIPVDYSLDVGSVHASAVIAIVASHSNLDILSFASRSENPLETEWLTRPALTLERFNNFLAEKNSERGDRFLNQFTGNAIGPWRAEIEVWNVDDVNVIFDLPLQIARTPVVFCRIPHNSMEGNILPRFKIRAHFIDKVVHSVIDSNIAESIANSIGMAILRNEIARLVAEFPWILPFFLDDQDVTSEGEPTNPVCQDEISGYNVVDLLRFAEMVYGHGQGKEMFITSNSVGFARCGFRPGDEVWALDGARNPFILRKTGHETYRIVSKCCLWAALELDYWNPGTKKGRWSEERSPRNEQQTHIIEIH